MLKEARMESLRLKRKASVKVAKINANKFVFEIHDNAENLNLFEDVLIIQDYMNI